MLHLLAIALIVVATASLYGWGRVWRRGLGMERGGWPATVALGLAGVVFIGGILNLLRLAEIWALAGLIGVGLLAFVLGLRRDFGGLAALGAGLRRGLARDGLALAAVFGLTAIVLGFTIWTQLPPRAFNWHDDYQKYFAHPLRMLQTGTLFGSPLSDLGSETLGGEAFLDAFVAAFFPIVYINGVDAVFGLFLCLMLASQFAGGGRALIPAALVSLIAVVFINPQYVNVSALYLGSALIMALIGLTADLREVPAAGAAPSAAAIGLIYAGLVALKTSFALFPALHLPAATAALCLSSGSLRRGLRWGVRTALFSLLFLAPWLLLHAPHYLAAFAAAAPEPAAAVAAVPEQLDLFSFEPLIFGASMANYTVLIAAIGACALISLAAARADEPALAASARMLAAAAAAGVAAYFIMLYLFGPLLAGYDHALRYFTPFAIGVAPPAFGLTALILARSGRFRWRRLRYELPLMVALVPVLGFAPSLWSRAHQAVASGSILAFSSIFSNPARRQLYLDYNAQVLHGREGPAVRAAQGAVPPGEPVLAWTNASFFLDYARNPIIDVEPAGLDSPWARMPDVRYVIWEYRGFAMRPPAQYLGLAQHAGLHERMTALRSLDFLYRLEGRLERARKLYDDGLIATYVLPAEPEAP